MRVGSPRLRMWMKCVFCCERRMMAQKWMSAAFLYIKPRVSWWCPSVPSSVFDQEGSLRGS